MTRRLPVPEPGAPAAAAWVAKHLGDLAGDSAPPSSRHRGGQRAADAALAAWDIDGYAARRNEVWPRARRGASGLSPYIRHGLLTLPRVWAHVAGGPGRDVRRFHDELLWQEYARHLYARLGARTARALRYEAPPAPPWHDTPWPAAMECMAVTRGELERDGWLVNQTRMWLASQWAVRAGEAWHAGEDLFFRHLLDGSRAANRLGWQWTVGTATGRPYAFSRWQVEKRAPGLCGRCELEGQCPIQQQPEVPSPTRLAAAPAALQAIAETATGAGPVEVEIRGDAEVVWITAESLGDDDPALTVDPDRPAVFVFDEARLASWQLSAKRLVFLTESLADLASRRPLEVWRGAPAQVLAGRTLAATYTPVPGWRALRKLLDVTETHPWPWLRAPHAGPIRSFSQWRKGLRDVLPSER